MNNQTEGQKRVRGNFNPSKESRVDKAKAMFAEAIDLLSEDHKAVDNSYAHGVGLDVYNNHSSDYYREIATAKTKIEEAAMWAVKALTNDIHKKDE